MAEAEERAMIPTDGAPPPSLLTGTPADRIAEAIAIANALVPVIRDKKLSVKISGREHVLYEGWVTLGALVGVFPRVEWSRRLEGGGIEGWEARVEAVASGGLVVGAAESQCTRGEDIWKNRDDYALRSMAQTRAGSKALRMPLGFIMALAGYEATPADEMPREASTREPEGPSQSQADYLLKGFGGGDGLLLRYMEKMGGPVKMKEAFEGDKLPPAIKECIKYNTESGLAFSIAGTSRQQASAAIETLKKELGIKSRAKKGDAEPVGISLEPEPDPYQ